MMLFLQLEGGYLAIAAFFLIVSLIVSTRKFVKKNLWKKSLPLVAGVLACFIFAHYYVTKTRIIEVENSFKRGEKIVCENRVVRKISQSVIIEKSNEWTLKEHLFSSPNYSRKFFSARCIKSLDK